MLHIGKLAATNHWWKLSHVKKEFVPKLKRELFYEVLKYVNQRQIIAVVGLRRTGKTTLFYQLIDHLLDKKVKPKNILYFSFDETVEELDDVIELYQEQILKKDMDKEKIYLFFDEIQKLKNWQNKIKVIYDLHPNVKIFVSGSASLNILVKAKETLAGRIFYFYLDLLSFREFLEFRRKKIEKMEKDIVLWKRELRIEMNNYLLKPFPEIVNANDEIAKRYIKESIVEKAIFRDLSFLFEIKEIELIEKLVYILANSPGMIVNLEDISKDLGRSRQVISNYLYYLQCCLIVKPLKNFKGSFKVSSRKLKKYYLIHPSLALALASPDSGKIIENLVMFKTKADFFWREGNKEVDFIVSNKKIVPVEVKYKKNVRKKEIKSLLSFMDKFKVKEGLVITEDKEEEEKIENKKIRFVPLWKWLLEDKRSES